MGTLNDEIRRATGGTTINDGLRTWFSATADESLNDAELRWLKSQPASATATTIGDGWNLYLKSLGYSGTLNDMQLQYWTAQP